MQHLSRQACAQAINLNQCRVLERRYPALLDLKIAVSSENAGDVFNVYCGHVKSLDPVASAVDEIKACEKLISEAPVGSAREQAQVELLQLQAARGMVHKAKPFMAGNGGALKAVDDLLNEHALHYGVNLADYDMTNAKRGHSMRVYFENHLDALRGKRVLHFAPEAELRPWMQENTKRLGFTYVTADGFAAGVDLYLDLCALTLTDESFDVVIMHRVLEHVIDDAAALHELHRILSPGGLLNISVPENLYLARTAEWRVPDPRAHMHFRVYGRDFPAAMSKAGFAVERGEWLLRQPKSLLRAANAYPMLFYNAVKM